jgi:SH3-like domain-containing protein
MHAAVPGTLAQQALARLRASDPFWRSMAIQQHEGWVIDGARWGCRPVDKLVVWLA